MEHLIGRTFEYKIKSNNTEDITFSQRDNNIVLRYIHIAKEDGRVYTKDGYIPYKKGQIVAYLDAYGDFHCERPVVFSTVDDLAVIIETERKKYKENKNNNNSSKQTCDCEKVQCNSAQ